MTSDTSGGPLYAIYRRRVGDPTTGDEVRGYWVFLVGLLLGTVGFLVFLPSGSAVGTTGLSLREASIFLVAVGLAMLVAGPVIRLPLQSWANYAAYLGQTACFAAAVWFLLVFPANWSIQTGNQPVILLYALGLGVITIGGVLAPLLVGVTREDLEKSEGRAAAIESELKSVRTERDRLAGELEASQTETAESESSSADTQARLDALYTSQARFELYEDRGDQWRWRLRHRNGNVVADGAQGYTRKHNAQKGMQSVRRNALGATTLLVEREQDLPEPEESFEPVEEVESKATFELQKDNAGETRWRLRHTNGNILGDGGEGYASNSNGKRAVEQVRELVGPADYLWFDPAGFEVYRDASGKWRWRLVHRNGNVLADGGQGYTRRNDANRAVDRLQEAIGDLSFEVYEDAAEEYRWRARSGNDNIVADSGEGYESRNGAERSVERVRSHAAEADTLVIGRAAFEIYADQSGKSRWRLRHRNGNILMDSGQGYSDRSSARDGIESVKRNAPNADLTA